MNEPKQIIKAIALHQITLSWEENNKLVPDSLLELNFAPFYSIYDLAESDVLLHFQAKPKGLRKWGIYQNKQYYSVSTIQAIAQHETLTIIDDNLPSNVILCRNAQVAVFADLIKIYSS